MQLGQRIQEIRKTNNLTQEAFAKLFHVTRQTVSNWENEKSYPDFFTLIEISNLFDVSLDTMLKEDIKMTRKLNNEIKWTKCMKAFIAIIIGVFVVSAGIWYLTWNYYKTATEDKFQKGLSKYEYSTDDSVRMGGYYIIPYDENTYFALPNQTMPGYFAFSTDFHAKDVDCYIEENGSTVQICWTFYDGKNDAAEKITIERGDNISDKLSDSEKEKYADILKFGTEIYHSVYR